MLLNCVTKPASEPITLAQVEGQCRINDLTEESDTIDIFIKAIREKAETVTRRALITQTWELTLDSFPSGKIILPKPPLQSVTSIKYIDSNGVEQTLASSEYKVVTKAEPGYVQPAYGKSWPVALSDTAVINIRYVCGYGPITPSTTLNIPSSIIQWCLLNCASLYENRETIIVADGKSASIIDLSSTLADGLIESYRIHRV